MKLFQPSHHYLISPRRQGVAKEGCRPRTLGQTAPPPSTVVAHPTRTGPLRKGASQYVLQRKTNLAKRQHQASLTPCPNLWRSPARRISSHRDGPPQDPP